MGAVFDFALLVRAAGIDEGSAAAAVEELVRRRIVHGVDDGFAFVHERVREVAYRRLIALQRGRLHRRVAEVMERAYADDLAPYHAFALAHAYVASASVHLAHGEYDRALRLFDWYQRQGASTGPDEVWPLANCYAGFACVRAGRIEEGLALREEIRRQAYPVTGGVGRSMLGGWLAEAYLEAGRPDEALALAAPAARLAHEHKERGYEAAVLRVLGDIAARAEPPDVATAEERYLHARAIADELGMRPLAARCGVGLGLLYRRAQRRLPARRELTAAAEACCALGMKADLQRAEAALVGL
jgi:tetratricopeptide (TPR) repeat protein